MPNVLHQVSVPIMNNEKCQKMFTRSGHKKKVRKSFLCAGYDQGKKDSCEVCMQESLSKPFRASSNLPIITFFRSKLSIFLVWIRCRVTVAAH